MTLKFPFFKKALKLPAKSVLLASSAGHSCSPRPVLLRADSRLFSLHRAPTYVTLSSVPDFLLPVPCLLFRVARGYRTLLPPMKSQALWDEDSVTQPWCSRSLSFRRAVAVFRSN